MTIFIATAADVQEGDSLPDIDNGYVFEEPEFATDQLGWLGRYMGALDSSLILIGFHDAHGNENYLLLQDDHPIKIQRED